MFGNKYSNIFRSRWKALWWASGVLLTAYCTIPDKDQDNSAGIIPGGFLPQQQAQPAPPPPPPNPWALDPAKQG